MAVKMRHVHMLYSWCSTVKLYSNVERLKWMNWTFIVVSDCSKRVDCLCDRSYTFSSLITSPSPWMYALTIHPYYYNVCASSAAQVQSVRWPSVIFSRQHKPSVSSVGLDILRHCQVRLVPPWHFVVVIVVQSCYLMYNFQISCVCLFVRDRRPNLLFVRRHL